MIHLLDEKLTKKNFKHYLFQSGLATLVLSLALYLPIVKDEILIAAIGSTAFVVFAMPYRLTARPRNVLGSHLVCGLIGLAFSSFYFNFLPQPLILSLAVGASILAMVTLDIEHPPAGGTVIFLAFNPDMHAFITLLLLVNIMAMISYVLRPYLIDLI